MAGICSRIAVLSIGIGDRAEIWRILSSSSISMILGARRFLLLDPEPRPVVRMVFEGRIEAS
jgi:hypothetical protein